MEAVVCSALGFLVGAFTGHRLAIGRDKRKEFNESADTIVLALSTHGRISDASIIHFERRASLFTRWRFNRALGQYRRIYKEGCEQDPKTGEILFTGSYKQLNTAANRIKRVCKWR
ncbi:hypothetical protein A3754_01945 [Alcanivorax sp. HI0083]|nr:hypothetical protein A3730_13020 [Alcanivorax sp. HI0044]KZZ25951.1 hypothetical protein A3754_01945 [Alcanivorax sp. HI0083]